MILSPVVFSSWLRIRAENAWRRTPANRLQSANYLVVYTEDENRSLSQAMYLREWYLRQILLFPVSLIAVYCEKRERTEQRGLSRPGQSRQGSGGTTTT